MSKFVNRVSSDLNKRTLKVIEERVKANGEIDELDVEIVRMNGDVTTEGTPLNADVFNEIVISIVKEMVGETALTNAERVELDKAALTVQSYAVDNFTVKLVGNNGTTITWSASGDGLSVYGDTVMVSQGVTDQTGYLSATITKGTAIATKTFMVYIPALEIDDPEQPENPDIGGGDNEEVIFTTNYSSDILDIIWDSRMDGNSSGIVFTADNGNGINVDVTADDSSYADCFDIYVQNNGGTTVLVDILENVGNLPSRLGTYTFTVEVVNNNYETLTSKTITISYEEL